MAQDEEAEHVESETSGFQSFEHTAADVVLAASYNAAGTSIVLCSADHRIRVYEIGSNKEWTLSDQFRGHDAEILDVQWMRCALGEFFATIGSDNKFKIWQEDPTQRPKGGRRFSNIYSQTPPNHVSYSSFGFKTVRHETYLALMTHVGSLSLLTMAEPESLTSWTQIDQLYPFGQHHRGTEARFQLSFQQSESPSPNALMAGMDSRTMSLAVSAMNVVKIYRVIPGQDPESNYRFVEVLETHLDGALINDIAWAPGCLRPFDLVAVACDDATVEILQVDTPYNADGAGRRLPHHPQNSAQPNLTRPSNAPSGIGAGLAGTSKAEVSTEGTPNTLEINHEVKEFAVLPHEESFPVWKVRWTHDGSMIASSGDNGALYMWKEDLDGNFIAFSETEAT